VGEEQVAAFEHQWLRHVVHQPYVIGWGGKAGQVFALTDGDDGRAVDLREDRQDRGEPTGNRVKQGAQVVETGEPIGRIVMMTTAD
jgi:hypothetical protein